MPLARPRPVRTDGSNAFAHRSMAERVPSIIDDVIARNGDYPPSIQGNLKRLRDAIAGDEALALFEPPAPDYDLWAQRFAPHAGASWLDTEWLFAEMLAYRLVLDRVRYWTTRRDPFRPMKDAEMTSDALADAVAAALGAAADADRPEAALAEQLLRGLWGNRMDLSIQSAAAQGTEAADEHLLASDLADAAHDLASAAPGPVHIIMDNAGTEEALDLVLADVLLRRELAAEGCT